MHTLHDEHPNGAALPQFNEQARPRPAAATFTPLAEEAREILPTDCAAWQIGRAPQTLRKWACLGGGLLQPVRIGTRLGWRTADIRALLAGGAK